MYSPLGQPGLSPALLVMVMIMQARFERVGDLSDLNAAIEAGRAAVTATPTDHPNQAMYLSNLGTTLRA